MKRIFTVLLYIPVFFLSQELSHYVNPFIGTGGHGHTFPGAIVPFGMVQLSPDTRIDGSWDGCSGYHYSDSIIYGFSHTHLNGTGVSDYGDIMLMPTMNKVSFDPKLYSSSFSHDNEKASAGYYEVLLNKHKIKARLTTTARVGFHEYTFSKSGNAYVILDQNHRDKLLQGTIKIIDNKTIEIYRNSEAWAMNQKIFARIVFDKTFTIEDKIADKAENNLLTSQNSSLKIALGFKVKKNEKIKVKVAISPTSYEGALLNSLEITHWNFEKVKNEAEEKWNVELQKVQIETPIFEQKKIFYTALYHTMNQPNIAMDIDGKYRGRDDQIHTAEGFVYYSVFSLWDTFRGTHPLYTLIDKKRTSDFINTFIKQYEQGGRLPVWELASNETDCMIGYHAVPVIADAIMKGIEGFDYQKAYEASKNSAMLSRLGLEAYKKKGFISMEDEHESVSKTLEYAFDDWCISEIAFKLNRLEEYQYYKKRSENWKNLYNPANGFIQARRNGSWYKPFDPREVNNNYTEGNAWQYSFFVPHDIQGLIHKHGGKPQFEQFLDQLFNETTETTGREQADITGLIGQYAHGNEPSHHMAYLYNFVQKPEKTKEKVHFILENFYKNAPDGLIGNEDCGQMSAWYILSSMGIYSVTPALPSWETTQPFFDKITLNLEDGTQRIITKKTDASQLNRLGFEKVFPSPMEISYTNPNYVEVPIISSDKRLFTDKNLISIHSLSQVDKLVFKTNFNTEFKEYQEPFTIDETTTIEAYSVVNGEKSYVEKATFYKKENDWDITILSKPNPQYMAEGSISLIDGIYGTTNWRKGDWHGYQSQDFECIIDLKKQMQVSAIEVTFLQDTRSWIVFPTYNEFYGSSDGKNFTLIANASHTIPIEDFNISIQKLGLTTKPKTMRYIKIIAHNYGKLPIWHQGAGGDAFIFVDEISIK